MNSVIAGAVAIFTAGAAVEVYTYNKDPKHSFGIGWGLTGALFMMGYAPTTNTVIKTVGRNIRKLK